MCVSYSRRTFVHSSNCVSGRLKSLPSVFSLTRKCHLVVSSGLVPCFLVLHQMCILEQSTSYSVNQQPFLLPCCRCQHRAIALCSVTDLLRHKCSSLHPTINWETKHEQLNCCAYQLLTWLIIAPLPNGIRITIDSREICSGSCFQM